MAENLKKYLEKQRPIVNCCKFIPDESVKR